MTGELCSMLRELDSREADGLQIRLLWNEYDERVWVTVLDTRNGEAFRLTVGDHERALDVFRHPFAYAAHHGVMASAQPETPGRFSRQAA